VRGGGRYFLALAAWLAVAARTPVAAQTPSPRARTIAGSGVLGVHPGDTLLDTVHALQGCDLRMLPQSTAGQRGLTLRARCGGVPVDYVLNPDSHTVQRAEVRDGALSTADGIRVGDDIAKAVDLYGRPTIETSEGNVCAVFAPLQGMSFCLRPADARAYLERVGSSSAPPLRGKIGSIVVFGQSR